MKTNVTLPNKNEVLSFDEYRRLHRMVPRPQHEGNPENFLVRPPEKPEIMIIKKAKEQVASK